PQHLESKNGKIVSLDDLKSITEQEAQLKSQFKHQIFVCMGTACQSCQSTDVLTAITQEVSKRNIQSECLVTAGGCQGNCAQAPLVVVEPQGQLYRGVTAADSAALIDSLKGGPVKRLVCDTKAPFFTEQTRLVTEYRGLVNPE